MSLSLSPRFFAWDPVTHFITFCSPRLWDQQHRTLSNEEEQHACYKGPPELCCDETMEVKVELEFPLNWFGPQEEDMPCVALVDFHRTDFHLSIRNVSFLSLCSICRIGEEIEWTEKEIDCLIHLTSTGRMRRHGHSGSDFLSNSEWEV